MTKRHEHGDGRLGWPEETRPSTLWLAVIPMVVLSLVGLVGGHTLPVPSSDGSGPAERTPTTEDVASAVVPADERPESALVDRAVPATSTTSALGAAVTTSTSRPVSAQARVGATAPGVPPAAGCGAALQWLSTHAAPGFRFECPGNALGHQGMTCVNLANVCPGQRIIAIADACPAAYMNEAHNSWILVGLARGRLDPYGSCA